MAKVNTSPSGGIGWRNLRTGLLFVTGLVLAALLGLVIGKNTSLFTRHDNAYLFLSSIKGLSEGNMVAISGKKIGVVKSMDFTRRDDTTGVLVRLDISHDYFPLITKDSRATIKALGVLGDKFVDITLGSSQEPLAEGGFLEVVAEPGLEELTASAIETMNSIQHMARRINAGEGTLGKLMTSDELHHRLLNTATHLEATTEAFANGNGIVARFLNDKAFADRVASTLNNIADVTAAFSAGKGSLGKLMVDESFYLHLSSATRRTDSLLSAIANGEGTVGKAMNDGRLYDNLNRTILSLDSLLQDLKQHPDRYVTVKVF